MSETELVAAAIFSMVAAAACITAAALVGGLCRGAAGIGCVFGVVADLADGRGHLLRRGGNLIDLAGLGARVTCALNRAGADLGGGGRERLRALGHGLQDGAHGGDAAVERLAQAADLIGATDADAGREVLVGHGFDGVLEPVEAGRDLAGENGAGERAQEDYEQGSPKVDPSGAVGGISVAFRAFHTLPGVEIEVLRHERDGQIRFFSEGVRSEQVKSLPRFSRYQQRHSSVAGFQVLLERCGEFLEEVALFGIVDLRLIRLYGDLIGIDGFLTLSRAVRGACRRLAQQQVEVRAPHDVHRAACICQVDHGGKCVFADICALYGDSVECEVGVNSKQDAQTAYDAVGEDELAGDREIA